MDDKEPDIELFLKAINQESLLYNWHRRSLGHDVQSEIERLEAEVYPEIGESLSQGILWQRDIDELQLLLSLDDLETNRDRAFITKKVFYRLQYTQLSIDNSKNHQRPHFHIEYKRKYRASYAIDNLELLAGSMPKRYEERMLEWAARRSKSLRRTWDKLQIGEDVRELVLDATEDEPFRG